MAVIKSHLRKDEEFDLNQSAYQALLETLEARRAAARRGGSEKTRSRHVARGRMLPRHRVEALIDPGSPFLEFAQLAGLDMHAGVPPGAGMITGIGTVHGRPCMIIANDSTVKGGTYFGITCRKHVRAQLIAWENRLPCITLVDSGGAFLPDQPQIFPDDGQFGSIFYNQVRMSAEGIPQIAVVMGPCTAGGAYIPSICDEVVIVDGQGYIFLGGPELTKAATGEDVDRETLGGARMHCAVSGVADHIARDDAHALAIARDIVANLPATPDPSRRPQTPCAPKHDPNDIYGIVSRDPKVPTDTMEIVIRLVDDSDFREFKPLYGDTLITGFGRINGFEVGILANRGVLFTESANKAAHFIELCCQRDIPLVFLADVTGFMVGREAETAGIAKAGAKMITAMASADVPKYTIMIGGAYGAGYLAMCGRAFKPTAMFAWPNGRAAIMGPNQAANTLAMVQRKIRDEEGKPWTDQEEEEFKAPIRKHYEDFANAYNFASHLWIDGIITPGETRATLSLLLDCASRVPVRKTRFGVFRV